MSLGDKPVWSLRVPARVDKICVGDEVEIHVESGGKYFEISLSSPFVYSAVDQKFDFDLNAIDSGRLWAIVSLRTSRLTRCTATESGRLLLEFANGTALSVSPREDVEAWQVMGLDGEFVVALPGGEVATWEEEQKS